MDRTHKSFPFHFQIEGATNHMLFAFATMQGIEITRYDNLTREVFSEAHGIRLPPIRLVDSAPTPNNEEQGRLRSKL